MSFDNTVSKLRSPIRELVLYASENGRKLLGNSENDNKEVIGWINKLSQNAFVTESNLKVRCTNPYDLCIALTGFQNLDSLLVPRTYIATNYLTAADVVLYGLLHPIIVGQKNFKYCLGP